MIIVCFVVRFAALVHQYAVAGHRCWNLNVFHCFEGSEQHRIQRRSATVSLHFHINSSTFAVARVSTILLQDRVLCINCLLTDEFYMGPVFSSNKQLNSTPYGGQWRSVQTMCSADCFMDERCTFVSAWQNRPNTDYWCAFYNNTFQEEQTQLPYQVDVQKKLFGRSGK